MAKKKFAKKKIAGRNKGLNPPTPEIYYDCDIDTATLKNPQLKIVKIYPSYMPKDWYFHSFLIKNNKIKSKKLNGCRTDSRSLYYHQEPHSEFDYYVITPGFATCDNGFFLSIEKLNSVIHKIENSSWEEVKKEYKHQKYYAPFLTHADLFVRKMAQNILSFFDEEKLKKNIEKNKRK